MGLLLPMGVLIAHFLRHRDPMWFLIHRAIQVTGICLALSGFIIAVTQFSVFHPGYFAVAQAHGYMGCIVMTIGFLQPLTPIFVHIKVRSIHVVKNVNTGNGSTKDQGWFAIFLAIPTICIGTTRWRRSLVTLSNHLRSFYRYTDDDNFLIDSG